jgi:hypothetical protein
VVHDVNLLFSASKILFINLKQAFSVDELFLVTVLQLQGGTAGIYLGGTRTLRTEGGKFADYLMLQNSQGIGLTIRAI